MKQFTLGTYLLQSLHHYWRWHLGLLLGVAISAWVIVGSLLVGDSVKATLARQATLRLGQIDEVVSAGEGFGAMRLATQAQQDLPAATVAPVLYLQGTVSVGGGGQRANGVNLYGVTEAFWKLGLQPAPPVAGVSMNQALAARLQVKPGDALIARFEKPSLISRDAPLSGESDQTAVLNASLAAIVADEALGAFSLRAEQTPPLNLFVPLTDLQQAAEQLDRWNLLLAHPVITPDAAPQSILAWLENPEHWQPADVGIDLTLLTDGKTTRIATPRIFLPETVQAATSTEAQGVLTYLCNSLSAGESNYTAYPMISAVAATSGLLPADLPADGIVVSSWLAESLHLKLGDAVKLNFFRVTKSRQLEEDNADFIVKAILPNDQPGLNAEWTPNFPGVTEAANCRDWKPGIPMKTKGFIREADETFWQQSKGTPKAFISLAAGQKLWANRFGNLTSLRVSGEPNAVAADLKKSLKLSDLGFVGQHPQILAKAAVAGSMDFGALFLSMSFFLIATALTLAALLFLFNVESRAQQIGLWRALGMTADRVRVLYLLESILPAVLGALCGAWLATQTTGYLLSILEGNWSGAVAGLKFVRVSSTSAMVNGCGVTLTFALVTVWWLTRRFAKVPPQRLLAGQALAVGGATKFGKRRRSIGFLMGMASLVVGAGMVFSATKVPASAQPGVFFGAAVFLLTGGLCACSDWLKGLDAKAAGIHSLWGLGLRNAVRRPGRSLAVLGLLAAGIFLVTSLHTFHLDAKDESGRGTGKFQFMGTSDLPIYEDLNTKAGREAYGLDSKLLEGTELISFRQRVGEQASCLNLNQAQAPSVLGVNPVTLRDSAFAVTVWKGLTGGAKGWDILSGTLPDGAIPALADQNSAMWALKKGLGDVVEVTNETGRILKLRLVGFVSGTILQGHVVISEQNFLTSFPATAGHRVYLVKPPPAQTGEVSQHLTRQLQNRGLALQPTHERLAELQAVHNTYLQIFSALGGMALILSTVALALLISRNALERRSEFALLQASGFRRGQLQQILLGEHLPLFLMSMVLGVFTALVAVWPQLQSGGQAVPVRLLVIVLGGMLAGGVLFCWLASRWALRQPLLESLRQE